MNNDTPADAITVTLADRDAADREAERIYFANSDVLCERDHEIMKVNLRQAFARHRTTSLAAQPVSSIDFHQRRGRAADLIDWAINEYDGFMMDDDYDSQRLLDRIAERFRAFRHDNLETPHE